MANDQKSLWNRIEHFSLDEPNVAFPFSRRLARENRWTHAHALRAIVEYKRFIFLGCVADHPVSPSEDVDQVWHLHLAYTKSYWKKFCGEVLGRPFHHEPTKGGSQESAKFEDWYAKTLSSYRSFFGEPPADLWPPAPVHHELKWVDVESHWIIRKPRWAFAATFIGVGLLLFAAGCGDGGFPNIFDMRGPDFLKFYFWFAVIAFVAAWFWRRMILSELHVSNADPSGLDAYHFAFLSGKGEMATNAALVSLSERNIFDIGSDRMVEARREYDPSDKWHPLEEALLIGGTPNARASLAEVRARAAAPLQEIEMDLQRNGLIYSRSQAMRARVSPLMVIGLVTALGLIKVFVGLSRNRPVIFLVLMMIAIVVLGLIFFVRAPFQTKAGNDFLQKVRKENAGIRWNPIAAGADVLTMAVALYGLDVLAGTPLSTLRTPLMPPPRPNNDGCSSSGCSSDSGGGGGSSCGGGGGGGGCGGCGGGGGD